MNLSHKNCGGSVIEDTTKYYKYVDDDGQVSRVPAARCERCQLEILSDADIEVIE